jgi:hypothetical protein
VHNKITALTLSTIRVQTGIQLGFGRFSVGEGTLWLGHASTKKMSLARARGGHWAALGHRPVHGSWPKGRMEEEADRAGDSVSA